MKDKNYNNSSFDTSTLLDGTQHGEGSKYPLSKHDFELYDEAKAIPTRVVRVKRMSSAAKGERWRFFENDELKFILDGSKLSKKECIFLRTIEGVNFLIAEFKVGFKSFNELRGRLKKKI
jgi:hypothetical protein